MYSLATTLTDPQICAEKHFVRRFIRAMCLFLYVAVLAVICHQCDAWAGPGLGKLIATVGSKATLTQQDSFSPKLPVVRKLLAVVGATASLSQGIPSEALASGASSISGVKVAYMGEQKPVGEMLGKKATLIVNVASQCALTPQYEELVALKKEHEAAGFEILGFPSNQFAGQEPGRVEDIREQTKAEYGRNFPLMDKVDVNGPSSAVIYQAMKDTPDIGSTGGLKKISWNFEKFLIDAEGKPVRRYRPGILPSEINGDVKALLTKGELPPRKRATLNDF